MNIYDPSLSTRMLRSFLADRVRSVLFNDVPDKEWVFNMLNEFKLSY